MDQGGPTVSIVLDCSITLAWSYQDEAHSGADAVLDIVTSSHAYVPNLWRLEVANGLQMGIRRQRIDLAARKRILNCIRGLDIRTDPDTDLHAWAETLDIAERYRLTVYDAAYAELAHRRRLPLATLDRELVQAAKALNIEIVGTD
jgi:predicted nucleic acid-binding protein